ncbi:MAG: aromatic aminobenezylarsenical efflux permease ArsG family transporter [Desulfobacterota bacterium]|nr:aromatic aminobenezylarsenical efflux permease ArsG family transporter [Thermodesulfobacteriota bacterium]
MDAGTLPLITAIWLGILTSISPCPLASNIAAVSFISRDISGSLRVFQAGALYVVGRVLCYVIIAFAISASLLNIPNFSLALQLYMPKLLGPALLLTGIILMGWFPLHAASLTLDQSTVIRLKGKGMIGALLLGFIFALAFCPMSAALFFGSMIPLALTEKSFLLLPTAYGFGTGLPVLLFALVICFSVRNIGKLFHAVTKTEFWFRRATGLVFIVIGLYYIGKFILLFSIP